MNIYFYSNLAKLRKAKKLSQQKLADSLGIKKSKIGAYEENRSLPSIDLFFTLSDYFGIDVRILFYKNLSEQEIKSILDVKR